MKKRFYVLDSFRGIAAICVVLFHTHVVGSLTEVAFFRGSFIFVDFFFVLSGFVLAHSYGEARSLQFPVFIKKRMLRLFPLHLLVLSGFILVEVFRWAFELALGYQFNDEPFSGPFAIKEILPNILLLQAWLPFANSFSFNAPSWSISVEFYLYILLFATVAFDKKSKMLLWVLFAVAALYLTWAGSTVINTEVLRGLRGFFGGTLIYVCFRQLQRMDYLSGIQGAVSSVVMTLLEGLAIVLIVLAVDPVPNYQSLNIMWVFFYTVFIFSFEAGALSRLLRCSVFQYLGRVSYSIYLTHSLVLLSINLILIAVQKYNNSINITFVELGVRYIDLGHVWLNQLVLLGVLIMVVAVSHLSYRHVELKWQSKH